MYGYLQQRYVGRVIWQDSVWLLTAEVCRHGDLAGIVYGYLQQRYVGRVIWQDSVCVVYLSVQGACGVVFTRKAVLISTLQVCVQGFRKYCWFLYE